MFTPLMATEEKAAAGTISLRAYLFLVITLSAQRLGAAAASVPVYVFGDSTVDVGNNNLLTGDVPKADFPPYGIDFPGGIPTGRFTNGFNDLDFVGKALGLGQSPPPYLSIVDGKMKMQGGVNFASGGAGILDTTGMGIITLEEQIKDFESVAKNLTARRGKKTASERLKKSLFFFSIGSNDLLAFTTLLVPGNSTQKDEIVAFVINRFKDQLQSIYRLGARKFAVKGTGLIGCLPIIRSSVPSSDCYAELNDLSLRFKTATKALLGELSTSLKGFEYSFTDFYEISIQIEADPRKYGFTEIRAACCGSGRLNAEGLCTPTATLCGNRSEYFFWDRIHPTQALYEVVAQLSVYGPPEIASPVSIRRLLKN